MDLATTEVFSGSWDVAEGAEDEDSDGGMDELAGQKNAELIEKLENQAIIDSYRYGSSMPASYEDEDIGGTHHRPCLLPMDTPRWQ